MSHSKIIIRYWPTVLFFVLFLSIVLFYILFVCECVLYYCHRVPIQLHAIYHIIYHIILYHIISNHIIPYHVISYHKNGSKGKAISLQVCKGPEGSRNLRLPEFLDIRLMKVVRLSLPLFTLVLISVTDWVEPRATGRPEGLTWL
jgi:hypothetical protein